MTEHHRKTKLSATGAIFVGGGEQENCFACGKDLKSFSLKDSNFLFALYFYF